MAKYTVIYRAAGESSPKRVVLKGADESSLRRECEDKGWQVLLIPQAKRAGNGIGLKRIGLRGNEMFFAWRLDGGTRRVLRGSVYVEQGRCFAAPDHRHLHSGRGQCLVQEATPDRP